MTRKLYDLCAADRNVRFSPPCWLIKFVLMHKGLDFESVPLRFTEKSQLPDPDYGLFPILNDGGEIVRDSAKIAQHLDQKYPENPLFKSEGERAAAAFYQSFLGTHLLSALAPLLFIRVHNTLSDDDKKYFRESREARYGVTLEALVENKDLPSKAEAALSVLAAPLENFEFFGGDAPNLSDYIIASPFMWQRSITNETLYETPKAIADWFDRILDLHNGYARKAPQAA